jgi:5-formyltetrahydrofolate cyclo-ligase
LSVVGRQKAELRRRMLAIRAALDPAAGGLLAEHVLRELPIDAGAAVAGVWPFRDEIDLRPLWHALHARGHAVLLPETTPPGHPLLFRQWHPDCVMIREKFGTFRPHGEPARPDVIFVPFLAFDRTGHRLGYGGGYYDRTLATHPTVPAVGIGYAALEVPQVPAGPYDRRLEMIFTERGKEAVLF